jgi:hypothetical protein
VSNPGSNDSAVSRFAAVGAGGGGKRDFDVTKVVATLLREHQWDPSQVTLTFVPRGLVDKDGRPVTVTPGKKASLGAITLSLE